MKDNRRKRIGYWILGILLAGILLFAAYEKITGTSRSVGDDVASNYEDAQGYKIVTLTDPDIFFALNTYKAGIKRIQIKNNLSATDIKSYDFSAPNSSTYGDNPSFEIYNKLGGQITYTSPKIDPSEYVGENSERIFTIANNVSGSDTNAPDLVVVITDVKKDFCEINSAYLAKKSSKNQSYEIPHLKNGINLLPYPQEAHEGAIINLPSERGCFSTSNGFVYYQLLVAQ